MSVYYIASTGSTIKQFMISDHKLCFFSALEEARKKLKLTCRHAESLTQLAQFQSHFNYDNVMYHNVLDRDMRHNVYCIMRW